MQTIDTKNRFIELRAQGLSYDKIANTLSVTKQTLIAWSKENRCELSNLKKIERDALMERLEMTEKHRLERLGFMLKKIQEELSKRDFSTVSTEKLSELFIKYLDLNQKASTPIVFTTEVGHEISLLQEKRWSEE